MDPSVWFIIIIMAFLYGAVLIDHAKRTEGEARREEQRNETSTREIPIYVNNNER